MVLFDVPVQYRLYRSEDIFENVSWSENKSRTKRMLVCVCTVGMRVAGLFKSFLWHASVALSCHYGR